MGNKAGQTFEQYTEMQEDAQRSSELEMLHRYMGPTAYGPEAGTLSPNDERSIYLNGDGFGDYRNDPAGLAKLNGGWDWSHIRDSSADAMRRMSRILKTKLDRNYNF